jgi:hypothetical protein
MTMRTSRLLHAVFGFVIVAQYAARGAIQELVVPPHQRGEGSGVPGRDVRGQVPVRLR